MNRDISQRSQHEVAVFAWFRGGFAGNMAWAERGTMDGAYAKLDGLWQGF